MAKQSGQCARALKNNGNTMECPQCTRASVSETTRDEARKRDYRDSLNYSRTTRGDDSTKLDRSENVCSNTVTSFLLATNFIL